MFNIWFYFSLSYSYMICKKIQLISPSGVWFACDGNQWVIFSCPCLNPWWTIHHIVFYPSVQLRRGVIGFHWYLASSQVKPPQYYLKNKGILYSFIPLYVTKENQDLISNFIEILIKDRWRSYIGGQEKINEIIILSHQKSWELCEREFLKKTHYTPLLGRIT